MHNTAGPRVRQIHQPCRRKQQSILAEAKVSASGPVHCFHPACPTLHSLAPVYPLATTPTPTAALRQGSHRRTKTLIQHKQVKLLTAHAMALCAQPSNTDAQHCGAKGRADTSTLQEKAAVRSGRSKRPVRPQNLRLPNPPPPNTPKKWTPPSKMMVGQKWPKGGSNPSAHLLPTFRRSNGLAIEHTFVRHDRSLAV